MAGEFAHIAIYGMTGQGKTTLAKHTVLALERMGWPLLIYSPTIEEGWPKKATMVWTADQLEAQLAVTKNNVVVIDEAYLLRKQMRPRHEIIATLGNVGRKDGRTVIALSQFPTAMEPALRWNCGICYCFKLANREHAEAVAEDYNNQTINGVPLADAIMQLAPLTCIRLTRESAEFFDLRHIIKGAGKGAVSRAS